MLLLAGPTGKVCTVTFYVFYWMGYYLTWICEKKNSVELRKVPSATSG